MDLDIDGISKLAEIVGFKEVAHNLLYFVVAAWIHSGRVGREIKSQMAGLIGAINAVRDTLQAEITMQNKRIETIQLKLDDLTKKPPCVNHGIKEGPQ